MEYRNLGRSGVKVSCLCLGTMNFGGRTPEDESIRIIHEAMDADINFIDTADVYGKGVSEQIVGKALSESGQRDQIVLATKLTGGMGPGVNDQGYSRYHLVRSCEASLKRLGTDRIDLYQLHFMNLDTPIEEALRAMDDLVRAGKVLYIGSSKFAPALLSEAVCVGRHNGWPVMTCEQPPYNLLDRTIENELIWTCLRHGIGIIPWAPLGSGILSGRYRKGQAPPEDMRRAGGGIGDNRFTPEAMDRVEALLPLADARGVTLAQFALAWLRDQPGVTAPIIGPRTLDHLHQAVASLDVRLTPEERTRIDEICSPGQTVSNYYDINAFAPLRRAIGVQAS